MTAHLVDANQGWLPLAVRKTPGCKRKVPDSGKGQKLLEFLDLCARMAAIRVAV